MNRSALSRLHRRDGNGFAINHREECDHLNNNTSISSCEKQGGQVMVSRIVTGTVEGLTIENNSQRLGTDSNVTDRHNTTVGCK